MRKFLGTLWSALTLDSVLVIVALISFDLANPWSWVPIAGICALALFEVWLYTTRACTCGHLFSAHSPEWCALCRTDHDFDGRVPPIRKPWRRSMRP
jgi:hypothetical protein